MIPRVLHQFWDTGAPPPSVQPLLQSWQALNPGWDYRLWSDDSILQLIKDFYNEDTEAAFNACKFPAMRADLGRYLALFKFGGVYADADLTCVRPLDEFINQDASVVFFRGFNKVWRNDFMGVSKEHPIVERFIHDAVDNISNRRFPDNLWRVAGPGMTTPIILEEMENGLSAQTFEFLELKGSHIQFNNELDYRAGDAHWSVAQKSEAIYVDKLN